MTIKEQLSSDIKVAMKSQDKQRLLFARTLHAAIRKKEVDSRQDLNDSEVLEIIVGLLKQRRESLEQFDKAGRQDLVDKENAEIEYLQHYLPKQFSEEEVEALVAEAIQEVQAVSMKDMPAVMKYLEPKIFAKADAKKVARIIMPKLRGVS
jgi:uncharacterized protein YqeY